MPCTNHDLDKYELELINTDEDLFQFNMGNLPQLYIESRKQVDWLSSLLCSTQKIFDKYNINIQEENYDLSEWLKTHEIYDEKNKSSNNMVLKLMAIGSYNNSIAQEYVKQLKIEILKLREEISALK